MTITEIAEKAGVSIGTVDRVIHNRGRVAPATEKRIKDVIEKYGYQPNPIARQLKLNKNYVIGVLLPLLISEDGYWFQCFQGIKRAEAELNPFSVLLKVEEFDRSKKGELLRQGKKLLESGIDALVLPPIVPSECEELLKDLEIPFAFFDSPLPSAKAEVTIAQNPFRGGVVAARIMQMLTCEHKKYASLLLYSAAYNSRERSRGFMSYFENDSSVEVIELFYSGEKSYDDLCLYFDKLFQINPDITGIFVVNDAVHYVGSYLADRGLKENVTLIGYDMIEENKKRLLDGSIDCLLTQRPEMQGYSVIHELFCRRILQQKTESVIIPIDIFFKENILDLE